MLILVVTLSDSAPPNRNKQPPIKCSNATCDLPAAVFNGSLQLIDLDSLSKVKIECTACSEISVEKIFNLTFTRNTNITFDLNNKGLQHLNATTCIFNSNQIIALNASHNNITYLDNGLSNCSSIVTLDLSFNELHVIKGNAFENMTNLANIYLNNNKLTVLENYYFNYTRLLIKATFSYNYIYSVHQKTFKKNTKLEYLDLGFNNLRHFYPESVANNSNIIYLDIRNNSITHLYAHIFDYMPKLKNFFIADNPWHCYDLKLLVLNLHLKNITIEARDAKTTHYIDIIKTCFRYHWNATYKINN